MAQFPKAEADIVALATAMVAGYGAHAADFPSADALGLTTALGDYNTTKTAQSDALGTRCRPNNLIQAPPQSQSPIIN